MSEVMLETIFPFLSGWPIIFVYALLIGALVLFITERVSPDVTALIVFSALLVSGILSAEKAFTVFSNQAPAAVAAMFVLSGALVKTGAVDRLGEILGELARGGLRRALLIIMPSVAVASAFINNTPVVAVFTPILVDLSRKNKLAVSKLLIPMSYAAILGGCCTLIGTSTNLIVSGISSHAGYDSFTMFELGMVGVPILLVGMLYCFVVGPWLLPERQTLSAILSPEERRQFIFQLLVEKDSPLIGQKVVELDFLKRDKSVQILEVRRRAARVEQALDKIVLREFDRLTLTGGASHVIDTAGKLGLRLRGTKDGPEELGLETLSTVEGGMVEGLISPRSSFVGKTLRELRTRQRFGLLVVAIHRHGENVRGEFVDERLHVGDVLLMIGSNQSFKQLADDGEIMLLEHKEVIIRKRHHAWLCWGTIAGVVAVAAAGLMPIAAAGIVGCVVLIVSGVMEARDAYKSIDWSIIFLIYGMLGLGLGLQETAADKWLAQVVVSFAHLVGSEEVLPYFLLAIFIIMTSILTEMVSNNAAAAVSAPLAISAAVAIGLDPKPFLVGVALAASASFATPIGYQTNTMVYGAGCYKFRDFFRFGAPLNIIFWGLGSILTPVMFPFEKV